MAKDLTCENCVFRVQEMNDYQIDVMGDKINDDNIILCSLDYNTIEKTAQCEYGILMDRSQNDSTNKI
jgi:hypothetical protein